jgi:alpha-L-fucosidase
MGDLYWPAHTEGNHHDLFNKPEPDKEYLDDWLLRCCEIVDRYHPRILYFDWWIQHSAVKPWLRRFAAYYYNQAEQWGGCVINYKHDAFPFGCAVPDIERGQFSDAKPFLWQSDTSVMRNSWCYSTRADYKAPREVIWDLVDVVSKNGRLLLNFGPKPDGTFTHRDHEILSVLGRWMKRNDEAIHGTGPWRVAQEGPTVVQEGQFSDNIARSFTSEDFRFTCRGGSVYAIAMECPQDGVLRIKSLREADASRMPLFNGIVTDVQVLGFDEKPQWMRDGEALTVRLGSISSDLPLVLKVFVT